MTVGTAWVLLLGSGCAGVGPLPEIPSALRAEASFPATLERLTGAPIVAGNRVEILQNGDQIFPAMLDAIRRARTTITYAQYLVEDGPITAEVFAALAERGRAGVGVNVLLDGFGSRNLGQPVVATLVGSGCHVAWFRPLRRLQLHRYNHRNHRRILVVDGHVAFTGGSGLSEQWRGNGTDHDRWRDVDVRVEGPIVAHMQAAFAESWYESTGIQLEGAAYYPALGRRGDVPAQVVASAPAGGSFAVRSLILLSIAAARRSIFITTPYFVPDRALQNALIAAVKRGVRVVILVPGRIDHTLVRTIGRGQYGRLLRAGVEIFEYRAALLHAKTMSVDGLWAMVGSANLDTRSLALNQELNLTVFDAELAHRLEHMVTEDLRHARRLTYARWNARSFLSRVAELIALPILDLL